MDRFPKQSQPKSTTSTQAKTKASSSSVAVDHLNRTSESAIRANERKQRGKPQLMNEHENELADMLFQRYGSVLGFAGISPYIVLMLILAALILWTGVQTATQIQQYRDDYKSLQKMKQTYQKLQVENQRLLIEQQTFSATPQIATRAVSKLGMFYPAFQDKLILQPISSNSSTNSSSSNVHNGTANPNNNGKKSNNNNDNNNNGGM